ncbi:MAG: manganese-dependent inorganic pyrophosphatase [Mycoplasmatales bacterium]
MNKYAIFGHKNPDTDTICSALAYELALKKQGHDAQAFRLGNISGETKFVLDYLNLEDPQLVNHADDLSEYKIIMVDHNEFNQSIDGIETLEIVKVIDHHRISNFQTTNPIYMRIEPVGCTSTILYKMFIAKKLEIDKVMATLMLSAIISDTLLFKSPTTTEQDVDVAQKLAVLAEVTCEEYGLEMLKAGAKLDGKTAKEIINIDSKTFETEEGTYEVGQVSTIGIEEMLLTYEVELVAEMNANVVAKALKQHILMVTDILTSDSYILVTGTNLETFEQKFNVQLENGKVLMPGVVSRKKQIIPFL